MKMKQVMSHNINNGLLNIIRRTDPMITFRALWSILLSPFTCHLSPSLEFQNRKKEPQNLQKLKKMFLYVLFFVIFYLNLQP